MKLSDFSRHVAVLAGGTAMAQAVNLLAAPLLSRLYTPAEYGDFTLFMALVSACAVVATFRYEMAVMLPEKEKEAGHLVWIGAGISLALCCVLTVVLLVVKAVYPDSLWGGLGFFLPFLVALLGVSQTMNNWMSRRRQYRMAGTSRIVQALSNSGIALAAAWRELTSAGLFLGAAAGQFLSALFLFLPFIRKHQSLPSRSQVGKLLREYRAFPRANMPFAIVGMLQINAIVFLLSALFGTREVGLFSRTLLVLQAPMWLMGSAIAQVFYQQASVLRSDIPALKKLTRRVAWQSAALAFPVYMAILLAGPRLFSTVFGVAWGESGIYAAILAPYMYFDFVRLGLSNLPLVMNRQRQLFHYTAGGVVVLVLALAAGKAWMGGIIPSFYLVSVLLSLYNLGMIFWLVKMPRK